MKCNNTHFVYIFVYGCCFHTYSRVQYLGDIIWLKKPTVFTQLFTICLLQNVCWPLVQTYADRYAVGERHWKDELQTSQPKVFNYTECKMLIVPQFNSFSYLEESEQFSSFYVCGLISKSISKLLKKGWSQHCPKELFATMEIFYTCTLQYRSHQPHVAVEHLKCGWCDQGTEFLILINLI